MTAARSRGAVNEGDVGFWGFVRAAMCGEFWGSEGLEFWAAGPVGLGTFPAVAVSVKKLLPKFLLAGCLLSFAEASFAQILPALLVEDIKISDSAAYADLLDEINAEMKDRYGVPLFLRGYESISTVGRGTRAFSLSPSASFEALAANHQRFEETDEFAGYRERLEALSVASGQTYLKGIRFDGTNSPGWLMNVTVKAEDEDRLLERVEALAFSDAFEPKVNVFRVLVGEGRFTHLVSLNFESRAALGAGMDEIARQGWRLEFEGCELVESVAFRELAR